VSEDGRQWTQIKDRDLPRWCCELNAVVVGGPGIVAINPGGTALSPDGLDWERGPDAFNPLNLKRTGASTITAYGDEVIATGLDENRPGAWRSHDGQHWQRLELPFGKKGGHNTLRIATQFGDEVIAISRNGTVYIGSLAPLD